MYRYTMHIYTRQGNEIIYTYIISLLEFLLGKWLVLWLGVKTEGGGWKES